MNLDVLFIHPPSIYDFRKRVVFPGPIAHTVSRYTHVFIAVPMGMISMAEYLERHGYKARILNLGEWMIENEREDPEKLLSQIDAKVYGVDLHWCTSSQGSIEVARICKKLHPNSTVVLGGLTASFFHDEIVKEFPFIDGVLRGESEEQILELAESRGDKARLEKVFNFTFRDHEGRIRVNPLSQVCRDLDDYDFSRVDLIEPSNLMLTTTAGIKGWMIPVARGCTHNCRHCGGSCCSYRALFGRLKPAPRSPQKIVEDILKLKERGVETVFLIQDPRICGERYWRNLFQTIREEKLDLKQLGIELFDPVNNEFLQAALSTNLPLIMDISPESGNEYVRMKQGRSYSNDQLIDSVEKCREKEIRVSIFFMIGCGEETEESLRETWTICSKLFRMDRFMRKGEEKSFPKPLWFKPQIGPMILLDPCSHAFLYPERHGYELSSKSFREYYSGLCLPSWHQWFNYQTRHFSKRRLAEVSLESIDLLLDLEERHGLHERPEAFCQLKFERVRCRMNYFIIEETDKLMKLGEEERTGRMMNLNSIVNEYLSLPPWARDPPPIRDDPFNYAQSLHSLVHKSVGILKSSEY